MFAVHQRGVDGTHEFTVDVTPEDLGPVRLTVILRDGEVRVLLAGNTDASRDALRAALPNLRRLVEAAGIGTGSVDVSPDRFAAGQPGAPQFGAHHGAPQFGAHHGAPQFGAHPDDGHLGTGQSSTGQSSTGQSSTGQSSTGQSSTGQSSSDRSGAPTVPPGGVDPEPGRDTSSAARRRVDLHL